MERRTRSPRGRQRPIVALLERHADERRLRHRRAADGSERRYLTRGRRLARATTITPSTTAMAPYTAHLIWPVMKLPGRTLTPCRNQMAPMSIMSAPTMLNTIFIGFLPCDSIRLGQPAAAK